jgi:hypothetical protein
MYSATALARWEAEFQPFMERQKKIGKLRLLILIILAFLLALLGTILISILLPSPLFKFLALFFLLIIAHEGTYIFMLFLLRIKIDFIFFGRVFYVPVIGIGAEPSIVLHKHKIAIAGLSPLMLSAVVFIDFENVGLWIFSILNLIGCAGDIAIVTFLLSRNVKKRLEWSQRWRKCLWDNAIWRRRGVKL